MEVKTSLLSFSLHNAYYIIFGYYITKIIPLQSDILMENVLSSGFDGPNKKLGACTMSHSKCCCDSFQRRGVLNLQTADFSQMLVPVALRQQKGFTLINRSGRLLSTLMQPCMLIQFKNYACTNRFTDNPAIITLTLHSILIQKHLVCKCIYLL